MSIEEFLRAPIVVRKWKVERTDVELVRFSLLWKIHDMFALKGLDFQVPILDGTEFRFASW